METIHYDIDDIAADYLDAHAYDYDDIPRREVLDPSVCSITIDHDFETSADYTFIVRVRTRDAVLRRELSQALGRIWFRCDGCADYGMTITLPNCCMPEEFVEFLMSHAAFTNTLRDAFADKRGELANLSEHLPDVEAFRIEELEDARSGRLDPFVAKAILPSCARNLALVRYEIEATADGIKLTNDAIAFLDAVSMFLNAAEPSAVYDDLKAMVADLDECAFPYLMFLDAAEPSAVYDDRKDTVADLDECAFPHIIFVA